MSETTPPCASAPLSSGSPEPFAPRDSSGCLRHDNLRPQAGGLRENPLSLLAVAPCGNELALSWSDGLEQFLSLEKLRESCPCAVCNGEPDVMGRGDRSAKEIKPGRHELKGYDFVGGYGLNLKWADGHSTGIYPYQLLRSLNA